MRSIIALVLIVTAAFFGFDQFSAAMPTKTIYITSSVTKAPIEEVVTATGSVDAVVTVEVGSQLSGQIAEIKADFNERVVKDQELAILDQQSYVAKLQQAEAALKIAAAQVVVKAAELERARNKLRNNEAQMKASVARIDKARARLEFSASNVKRKEALKKRGATSDTEVEAVIAERRAAAAAVREAEAQAEVQSIEISGAQVDLTRFEGELAFAKAVLPEKQALVRAAQIDLARTIIRSPISGVVINRNIDAGQTVAASLEAPTLFTIAQDLSEMEVHARVDEADIGQVAVGQDALFTVDAYPDREFKGEVVQIRKTPLVLSNVVTYRVVIRTPNPELLLLPGMTAIVRIIAMRSEDVVQIPSAALEFSPQGIGADIAKLNAQSNRKTVWKLLGSGELEAVEISTGISNRTKTAVVSGPIFEGDEIVINEIIQPVQREFLGIRFGG